MAKKLLVVDSNLAIQKLVEYNLSREKFEVTCLNDGLSALDLLTHVDPDLILADYHLEGISFTRFCEKVKQKQTAKERPILVLVGATDSYDPNKLVSLGVVDFVKKPLEPKELIEKLKELSQDTATLMDKAPRPVVLPAAPAAAQPESPAAPPPPTVKEQAEIMKIEELLGWSLPGEKPAATQPSENRIPDQDNEMTMIQNRAEAVMPPSPVQPEPPVPLVAESKPLPDDAEQTMIAMRVPPPPVSTEAEAPPPVAEPPEAPPAPITPATLENQFPHLYAAPETVETPTAEAQIQPAVSGAVSQEMVEALVSKIAKEIIEKVAWDVVPSLAETLIKEELEKLKTDKPS